MDGHIFSATTDGWVFKLTMSGGEEVWRKRVAERASTDTWYVEAHGGIIVLGTGVGPRQGGGSTTVRGVNSTDGSQLWEFEPDVEAWNFQAQFSSDGESFVFQDIEGRGYRVGSRDGRLIWKSGAGTFVPHSFTDGGALLAEAQGKVYTVASSVPASLFKPDTRGYIHALNFADGRLLWVQPVGRIPNSWPAVGPLRKGAKPSVVIPVGLQGSKPVLLQLPAWMPVPAKYALHYFSLWLGDYQVRFWQKDPMPLDIYAFDAESGTPQWMWKGPVHRRVACGGDEEGVLIRQRSFMRDICWPGPWTAPTIDSEGTVYVGAQNGEFVALWDGNGDGKIDDATEVSRFDTGGSSALHPGPALAPGLLAYPTCDGLFVFKAPS